MHAGGFGRTACTDLQIQKDHANKGALIIRIGFWGQLYHSYNKNPPKIV